MIKQVAERLGNLRAKVVFLGGSAAGFHITDKAAPEVRATKDVDIIVEVASRVEYNQLENTLRELGFFQKIIADDPICRWYIDDEIVDVMPKRRCREGLQGAPRVPQGGICLVLLITYSESAILCAQFQ